MTSRLIHCGDGIAWTKAHSFEPRDALVTSLPDISEMGMTFPVWKQWFQETAKFLCEQICADSVAIFYQTDIKRDGVWIDKSYLVQRAAEDAGASLLWHKVICRVSPGQVTFGRPSYSHILCVSPTLRLSPGSSSADVIDTLGDMTWSRAIGTNACIAICKFLRAHTQCKRIVDPFCGQGVLLAIAESYGFDAIGVELSQKRARAARQMKWPISSRQMA